MIRMGEKIEMNEKQIEIMKRGSSSSKMTELANPTDGLSRALADLNLKGFEVEKLKKTISTQNEEIKDKDKFIEEYKKMKAKMLTYICNFFLRPQLGFKSQ